MTPDVLIVDDNPDEAQMLATGLTAAGYAVHHASDALTGLLAVEEQAPDLVLLAWDLPFIDGPTFVRALQVGLPTPPPVLALRECSSPTAATAITYHVDVQGSLARHPSARSVLASVQALVGPPFVLSTCAGEPGRSHQPDS